MINTADRLRIIKPSPSATARARVDVARATGATIIDLTIGEPDFQTPVHIVEAGITAAKQGPRYTGPAGTLMLREAIASKFYRQNGLAYEPREVIVGSGAKQIIFCAFAATLNEGDEVIIPAPYWVSYPDMVRLQGAFPVELLCPASQSFKLLPSQLEKAITPRTRWLLLNSPNNPSGAVYSETELAAIGAVLQRHPHVCVMSDEIYEEFIFEDAVHRSILNVVPALRSRTLIVNGVSKTYAMTGWRLGYAAGPKELIDAVSMLISQSTSCANSIAQAAAVAALNGPQEHLEPAIQLYKRRKKLMCDLLRGISGFALTDPEGAFYVFPSVEGLLGYQTPGGSILRNDVDVVNYFIDTAGVATIDGQSYGAPGYLRLCFAVDEDHITEGCSRLSRACALLTKPTV
jgi:aspartate aminotransferase